MENLNTGKSETTTSYIVDADDFCESNSSLDLLKRIHEKNPDFKINLFTIIGRCSDSFIEEVKKIGWIDMIPHGWMHETSRECEHWTYEQGIGYLDRIEKYGLTKGFKAPGWQISDGMYRALLERGYWVADQEYNNGRRPEGLKAYLLDAPHKLHYHIGHLGGFNINEIAQAEEMLATIPCKLIHTIL